MAFLLVTVNIRVSARVGTRKKNTKNLQGQETGSVVQHMPSRCEA